MKWLISLLLVIPLNAYSYELYLVRHFEKRLDQADPHLTEQGIVRAQSLASLLADKDLKRIYSTDYKRTQQTALPTAERTNISITSYSPLELEQFAKQIRTAQQTALVVGHSNTTPQLLAMLGGESKSIAENEYGELFVLIVLPGKTITQSVMVGNRQLLTQP